MDLFKIFYFQIQFFHLPARPRGTAQEFQARFYAGVVVETADVDFITEVFPSIKINQPVQDHFKSDAMEWIVRLSLHL